MSKQTSLYLSQIQWLQGPWEDKLYTGVPSFFVPVIQLVCLSDKNKKGANKNNQVKGPF